MNAFRETITPKEVESPEKGCETDRPMIRESDMPRLPSRPEAYPDSNATDIFATAFKNFGLTSDSSEKSMDMNERRDYSNYLEKRDDGIYNDKETGKAYDSIEAWEKAQETLAKRYESTAKYYEERAKKEWARFKNADANDESTVEKWDHYRQSQEDYAKAKEYKEKAERTWERLGKSGDASNDSSRTDAEYEKRDVSERKSLTGQDLLDRVKASPSSVSDMAKDSDDSERIKDLCEEISENSNRDDEVEPTGKLLPKYQKMMDDGEYDSIEEMCNDLGLNYDEVFDYDSSTYGEEYQNGFKDGVDKDPDAVSGEEHSDAYYEGFRAVQELKELLNMN